MFSRLGEGDRCWDCGVAGAVKYGETDDAATSDGDSKGGLLDGLDDASCFIQGLEDRFSDTADSTGEGALARGPACGSSLPSA